MKDSLLIFLCGIALVGCTSGSTSNPATKNAARDRQRLVILIMLPAYGKPEQIRAGNMGHAAIEFDGRLHDIGSLNGYAFTFRPSTGVRFWPFANADAALRAIAGQFDCDGYRDSITRFDVTITSEQVSKLQQWWDSLEAKMADPNNHLYLWSGLQCASAVAESLQSAGIIDGPALTPADLCELLKRKLRNSAGMKTRQRASMTVVQSAITPTNAPPSASPLLHVLGMFDAGERSALKVTGPDGLPAEVLWSDSDAYRACTGKLAIQPSQVVALARKFDAVDVDAAGAQSVPNFIIGRWYHVESDHIIGQAALAGWYVNGDDGRVIHHNDRRVIRFDAFSGDRVVESRG